MRLLVTGTGRSGTTWMARALTAAGVPCGHEHAFTDRRHGGGEWTAEASWLAAPYLPQPGAHVVHLVRDPLAVIRSWAVVLGPRPGRPRRTRRYLAWAGRHTDALAGGSVVERAARWYVAWNQLVEPHAAERVRLEDVDAGVVTRLARLVDPAARLDTVPPPARTGGDRLGPPVTWPQVAHIPGLTRMAERYGYR